MEIDRNDLAFSFVVLENQIEATGCLSRWMKQLILLWQRPPDVIAEMKDIVSKTKMQAGATDYKVVKDRIIKAFGPQFGDAFREALGTQMTGKPYQLVNKLINLLCSNHPNLENNCCMEEVITGMWQNQLPEAVKAGGANHRLGGGQLGKHLGQS